MEFLPENGRNVTSLVALARFGGHLGTEVEQPLPALDPTLNQNQSGKYEFRDLNLILTSSPFLKFKGYPIQGSGVVICRPDSVTFAAVLSLLWNWNWWDYSWSKVLVVREGVSETCFLFAVQNLSDSQLSLSTWNLTLTSSLEATVPTSYRI